MDVERVKKRLEEKGSRCVTALVKDVRIKEDQVFFHDPVRISQSCMFRHALLLSILEVIALRDLLLICSVKIGDEERLFLVLRCNGG
jgi:hypothetical protein